jgi:8-oxo-dGTP pyrophosphatase MutT (NUDIX family)
MTDFAEQPMRVVAPFITGGGFFYFQRRSADARRGAAGMVGTFGGKVEPGETDRQAAVREVGEETTLSLPLEAFRYLGECRVRSDSNLRAVTVDVVAFIVEFPRVADFEARDGELVVLPAADVSSHLPEMTPGTRAGWEAFIAGRYAPPPS